jgi:hypothetical protein
VIFALLGCAPKLPPEPLPPKNAGLVEITGVAPRVPLRQQLLTTLATATVTPCYEAALARDPQSWGEIVIRFVVTAGAVTDASVHLSTLGDDLAEACVVDAVRALVFTGVASTSVVYPFVFTSDATPPEVTRALKVKYKLLPPEPEGDPRDPRDESPPGVVYLW